MTSKFPQLMFVREALRRSDIQMDLDDFKAEMANDKFLEEGGNPEELE